MTEEDVKPMWSKLPDVGDWVQAAKPAPSDWMCYLIGGHQPDPKGTVIFHPAAGTEPNWFHRWMQQLAFGVKWVKK